MAAIKVQELLTKAVQLARKAAVVNPTPEPELADELAHLETAARTPNTGGISNRPSPSGR